MTTTALKVRNLRVTLPTGNTTAPVVNHVSLDLQHGEVVGLAGESGCGKTMLALALMGLLGDHGARVEADTLELNGRPGERPGSAFARYRGKHIAMIFQEPGTALDPVFSIGWQLRSVLQRRFGLPRQAARRRTLDALANAGFADPEGVYRAYPHQLSGGMRQLVMITMASLVEPDVLIADEPTTALDTTTQRQAMSRLLALRDRVGTSILLITHDIGLIAEYCSRILVMYCGRLVESSDYADFYTRPRHPYSAGLLNALPRLDGKAPARAMRGTVAVLSDLPPGCPFAPRCDYATNPCREQMPAPHHDEGRMFACHHPL
jgi:oligopeptide/dipeptide ABC transporter ATP-binding protein